MNVIILEDEPLMAEELAEEIKAADSSIQIVGKFESVRDALDFLTSNCLPDLFFSDIQLADGLSFDVFSQIKTPIPVIFCTAFDEYALQAFKANGIDYLLKPFDSSIIKETIIKYQSLMGRKRFSQDLSKVLKYIKSVNSASSKSLIIHQGQKIYPVKYSDIRILFLKDGITCVITKEAKKHIINSSLDRVESELDGNFYRANRQVIIHRDAIEHISTYFARKLLVTPTFKIDMDIIVSKANASSFLSWLEFK